MANPDFTRRHYERIARSIRETRVPHAPFLNDSLDLLVVRLADEFQADNPSFRRAQFYVACGGPRP